MKLCNHFALEQKSEYIFALDADVHLEPKSLDHIIQRAKAYNLKILAPMVAIKGKMFTNFWGSVSANGYYERSQDYLDIVEGDLKEFWNVPFISAAILFSAEKLQFFMEAYNYERKLDADMSFAKFCRDHGHFMYVDNQEHYGQLLSTEQFASLSETLIHAEVYDYPANKELWEKRYIHPEYFHYIQPGIEVPLPCPDVYDFPFLSLRMSKEIIEIMEHFGTWSDGKNFDRRLEGGYENVPTRDIHMNQVGFEPQWLQIIDDYVAPMQEKVFTGYYQRPIKANMMFVVRYRPDEQASLRPHHDASTYSIDISLNKRDVDYEGGGVRYIRYNCTVPADEVGWSMLFPGRLTHLHEGLPTTKGTRYILVSFINP
uniref:procollagen-lysine 5-dioxygenase n=1 Tax=Panagrolaimus superbus TaxID=310955 RepID=A0A914Z7G6_9BILA